MWSRVRQRHQTCQRGWIEMKKREGGRVANFPQFPPSVCDSEIPESSPRMHVRAQIAEQVLLPDVNHPEPMTNATREVHTCTHDTHITIMHTGTTPCTYAHVRPPTRRFTSKASTWCSAAFRCSRPTLRWRLRSTSSGGARSDSPTLKCVCE